MAVPKTAALPLGDAPTKISEGPCYSSEDFKAIGRREEQEGRKEMDEVDYMDRVDEVDAPK